MLYKSTRGGVCGLTFEDVLFSGYMRDGGLAVPEEIPNLTPAILEKWSLLSYSELVVEVLSLFICESELPKAALYDIVRRSFQNFDDPNILPVIHLKDGLHVAELFHGPTKSFKDLALSVLGQILSTFLVTRNRHVTILVGTSGDTGAASIESVRGSGWIDIIVLYPEGRCYKLQELQMTTYPDKNVHCIAVEGSSDDLDKVIYKCFTDEGFASKHNLVGLNSTNWVRIAVQIAHFFYIYFKLSPKLDKVIQFIVPTGGGGHVTGGYLARAMGLPISLVVATNKNDAFQEAVLNGKLSCDKEVMQTLAVSMDIQIPYNLERLLYFLSDCDSSLVKQWMTDACLGTVDLPIFITEKLQRAFKVYSVQDEQIKSVMKLCWNQHQYIICPHTATALYSYYELFKGSEESECCNMVACLATASPAKFPELLTSLQLPVKIISKLEKLKALPIYCHYFKQGSNWENQLKTKIEELTDAFLKLHD